MSKLKPSLAVALDNLEMKDVLPLVDDLQNAGITWLKVGLELYTKGGPALVKTLKEKGFSVFLDLKFHDIPNTVMQAVREVAATGADLLTVHCSGGPKMLKAAATGAEHSSLKVVGVTVLTSLDASDFEQIGDAFYGANREDSRQHCVKSLATMAAHAGLAGIVCSVPDLMLLGADLRKLPWTKQPVFVTPGIRESGAQTHDQSSIATPEMAISSGSTLLVVGRPVLRPATGTTKEAAKKFLKIIGN